MTDLRDGEIAVDNIEFKKDTANNCSKRRGKQTKPIWSDWTDWSRCSVSCGQGIMIRRRICSVSDLCEGKAFETQSCTVSKSCFKNNSNIFDANQSGYKWSDWEFSDCTSELNCGKGVRTKHRICQSIINSIPVSSFKCEGPSFVITDCFMQDCVKSDTIAMKPVIKSGQSWTNWSDCSSSCGNGIKSRARQCYDDELNCIERQVEQITCSSYEKCTDKRYFMVCSFDKKENCSVFMSNPGWLLTNQKNNPHLPNPFGNFIYLKNSAKFSYLQTQLAADETSQGQCLFFNYYLKGKVEFQVKNVIPDSSSNEILFSSGDKKITEKWMLAFITIKPPEKKNYFIQFSGKTSDSNDDSLIALDNIVLHPVDFCKILKCSFEDNNCIENLFPYQDIQKGVWTIKKHPDSSHYYLNAYMDRIKTGKKSFYGFPTINPLHSKMCVKFSYFIDSSENDLRLMLVWKRIDMKHLWSHSPYSKVKAWQRVMLDIDEALPFQFVLDVYKKSGVDLLDSNRETDTIGLDDLEVTYGKCNQEELIK